MNTTFALAAKYESSVVELKEVCKEFFGVTEKTAKSKAAIHKLPVPTFRLVDSQNAPLFIKIEDLAQWIDSCHSEQLAHWQVMQDAKK